MRTDYLYHGTALNKAESIFRSMSLQGNAQGTWDDLVIPDNNTTKNFIYLTDFIPSAYFFGYMSATDGISFGDRNPIARSVILMRLKKVS